MSDIPVSSKDEINDVLEIRRQLKLMYATLYPNKEKPTPYFMANVLIAYFMLIKTNSTDAMVFQTSMAKGIADRINAKLTKKGEPNNE